MPLLWIGADQVGIVSRIVNLDLGDPGLAYRARAIERNLHRAGDGNPSE
jgi:hypothetical protein